MTARGNGKLYVLWGEKLEFRRFPNVYIYILAIILPIIKDQMLVIMNRNLGVLVMCLCL